MSNKSNEERLRILQERLNQIREKQNSKTTKIKEETKVVEEPIHKNISKEELTPKNNPIKKKLPLLVLLAMLTFIALYIYKDSDINIETITKDIKQETIKEEIKIDKEETLKYTLNFGEAKHIILLNNFEDESTAKALVNDKKINGYKADYFFLPDSSNSNEKLYQVYIGPFLTIQEANQWANTLEENYTTISL